MAADEHQSQHIIFDMINGCQEVLLRHLTCLHVSDSGIDLIAAITLAELINCPALGRGHELSTGVVRDAGCRPSRQRSDWAILSQILSQPDISYDPD
jgi:hypothetical protein